MTPAQKSAVTSLGAGYRHQPSLYYADPTRRRTIVAIFPRPIYPWPVALFLIQEDGEYIQVTDPHNISHWVEDTETGRLPALDFPH